MFLMSHVCSFILMGETSIIFSYLILSYLILSYLILSYLTASERLETFDQSESQNDRRVFAHLGRRP